VIELNIPEATPSLNVFNGRHWSHYRKHRKHWSTLVMVAKSQAGIHGRPAYPRSRVNVERYGARILDCDNYHGGLKALIDGLKDNGLIADDSHQHVELKATQHRSGERKTIVRIEAI
jgi:Holliday junction resolvase RusA-like endonuclease